ncbi:hypothetical protein BC941DRAFT_353540 [Chlamydoabsidia padenii]|nr:hypothetical protein BC941DRAFT_353540 [Chlamydoabsidia padenii]
MENNISYIMTYDNTEQALIKYASDSVTELIGYRPEELVGKPGFFLFDPIEVEALRQIHISNVMNEKLCSMISYNYRHKNGNFIKLQTIIHYCCDTIASVTWAYDPHSLGFKQRMNSVDEAFEITDKGKLQLTSTGTLPWRPKDLKESMKHSLTVSKRWHEQKVQHEQEPRFHILMNRFSENMNIVYVSNMVMDLLGVHPSDLLGKSIYDVVHYLDRPVVEAQCTSAKSHYVTNRIRFDWLVDIERDIRYPVDSVVTGSTDGLLMVVRLAQKPVKLSA